MSSAKVPAFRPVELATLVDAVPAGDDWIHEVKLDGYRCLLALGGGRAKAFTRSGLDWSQHFQSVLTACLGLKLRSALIDGEAVVLDKEGRSHFQSLQTAFKGGTADVVFFAFDLLELDGVDLTTKPLIERKRQLAKLIGKGNRTIRMSEHFEGQGQRLLEQFCEKGLEGVVSKRKTSKYVGARTKDWVKTKCLQRQEFVIVGWTPSDKARGFRSLLIAVNKNGELRYAGRVGTGFDVAEMRRLTELMAPLEQKQAPIDAPKATTRGAHWLKPELVAEVAFTEVTADGVLRHPSYQGLRNDKKAEAIVLEKPAKAPAKAAPTTRVITITHPERVIFPEASITKGELADYYQAIAEVMLPWVAERPVSLIRCPQGRAKKCFFQKHDAGTFGDPVKHVAIREKNGKSEPYLFVEDVEGLLTCVQMGTIEFHGWGSRIEDVEKADRLIFDLDPDEGIPFKDVVRAASEFRDLLKQAGLTTFAMVTGGKGVHVIAPLTPRAEWPAVKDFAQSFAQVVANTYPDKYTANPLKARRGGRIFIDYLRNARGATAVAPYSVRARPEAPVAAPVSWDELKSLEGPAKWHVGDVRQLLKRASSQSIANWGRANQFLPEL